MIKMKTLILLGMFLLIATAYQPIQVEAHTPGPMTLTYDFDTQILNVTVTHVTEDVNTHYIYELVIEKNSVIFTTEGYTSQSSASGMSDTFNVPTVYGDSLRATAKCIISGQVSQQIIVSNTTAATTTITTPESWTPTVLIILSVIIALGVAIAVVLVLRRR